MALIMYITFIIMFWAAIYGYFQKWDFYAWWKYTLILFCVSSLVYFIIPVAFILTTEYETIDNIELTRTSNYIMADYGDGIVYSNAINLYNTPDENISIKRKTIYNFYGWYSGGDIIWHIRTEEK